MTDQEFEAALDIVDKDRSGDVDYVELSRAIRFGNPDLEDDEECVSLSLSLSPSPLSLFVCSLCLILLLP